MSAVLLLVSLHLADSTALAGPDGSEGHLWRSPDQIHALSDIGAGMAVIFSPDLAVPGNRFFYERLGFIYIETPNWNEALRELEDAADESSIRVVLVETHGTNGNGLKIQLSSEPGAARSYISMGGLQQRLEVAGIAAGVISACNSGRLFRPGIYQTLDPAPDEPLFLPPTLGIIQASSDFEREVSAVVLLRRKQSNLETLMEGKVTEFAPDTRTILSSGTDSWPSESSSFIISTMLIQMLLDDPALELTTEGYVNQLSRKDFSPGEREVFFRRFLEYVDSVARRERTEH